MHDDPSKAESTPSASSHRPSDVHRKGALEFIVGLGVGMALMATLLGPTSSDSFRKVQEENLKLKQLNATFESERAKALDAQERGVHIHVADDEPAER